MSSAAAARLRRGVYRRLGRFAGRVHGRGPLLVAVGDSLTDPRSEYTLARQVWVRIVGRHGFRTLNLGVWGETTADMRDRIEQVLDHGTPEIAILFGGTNDAMRGVDPGQTEADVAFIVAWLQAHGVETIALVTPGLLNWSVPADWAPEAERVREVLTRVAADHGVTLVDLAAFQRGRLDSGRDLDFSRVPYRQSRSWYVADGDPHFSAYGQRLVAAAVLEAVPGLARRT